MSETPRTDQMEQYVYWFDDDLTPVCESRFVRPLEMELIAAQQRIKRLEEMYEGEIGENEQFLGSNLQGLLIRELNWSKERIKRLEEAGDVLAQRAARLGLLPMAIEGWRKAKEAKP